MPSVSQPVSLESTVLTSVVFVFPEAFISDPKNSKYQALMGTLQRID